MPFVDGLLVPAAMAHRKARWRGRALAGGVAAWHDCGRGPSERTGYRHGRATEPIVRADLTVTFGAPKTGFANLKAWKFLGHLEVVDIGLPHKGMPNSDLPMQCMDAISLGGLLPRRARDSHKGNYGHVLVIAGSRGLNGAPALAALGALRGGAGWSPRRACGMPGGAGCTCAVGHGACGGDRGGCHDARTLAALPKRPEMFDVVVAARHDVGNRHHGDRRGFTGRHRATAAAGRGCAECFLPAARRRCGGNRIRPMRR